MNEFKQNLGKAWADGNVDLLKTTLKDVDVTTKKAIGDAWAKGDIDAYKTAVNSIKFPETAQQSEPQAPAYKYADVINFMNTDKSFAEVKSQYPKLFEKTLKILQEGDIDLNNDEMLKKLPGTIPSFARKLITKYNKEAMISQRESEYAKRREGSTILEEGARAIFPDAYDAEGFWDKTFSGAVNLIESPARAITSGIGALQGDDFMAAMTAPEEMRTPGEKVAQTLIPVGSLVKAPVKGAVALGKMGAKAVGAGKLLSEGGAKAASLLSKIGEKAGYSKAKEFYKIPGDLQEVRDLQKTAIEAPKFAEKFAYNFTNALKENGIVDAAYIGEAFTGDDGNVKDGVLAILGAALGNTIASIVPTISKKSGIDVLTGNIADKAAESVKVFKKVGISRAALEKIVDKFRKGEIDLTPDNVGRELKEALAETYQSGREALKEGLAQRRETKEGLDFHQKGLDKSKAASGKADKLISKSDERIGEYNQQLEDLDIEKKYLGEDQTFIDKYSMWGPDGDVVPHPDLEEAAAKLDDEFARNTYERAATIDARKRAASRKEGLETAKQRADKTGEFHKTHIAKLKSTLAEETGGLRNLYEKLDNFKPMSRVRAKKLNNLLNRYGKADLDFRRIDEKGRYFPKLKQQLDEIANLSEKYLEAYAKPLNVTKRGNLTDDQVTALNSALSEISDEYTKKIAELNNNSNRVLSLFEKGVEDAKSREVIASLYRDAIDLEDISWSLGNLLKAGISGSPVLMKKATAAVAKSRAQAAARGATITAEDIGKIFDERYDPKSDNVTLDEMSNTSSERVNKVKQATFDMKEIAKTIGTQSDGPSKARIPSIQYDEKSGKGTISTSELFRDNEKTRDKRIKATISKLSKSYPNLKFKLVNTDSDNEAIVVETK